MAYPVASAQSVVAAVTVGGPLVITGVTESGKPFRPSDWAQRLATAVGGRDRYGRIRFHPMVRVAIADGVATVIVDGRLAVEDPSLYGFLRNFAYANGLRLTEPAAGIGPTCSRRSVANELRGQLVI